MYWDAGCSKGGDGQFCEPTPFELERWDILDANQTPYFWPEVYDPCWEKEQYDVDVRLSEPFTWPGGYYELVGRFDPIADPVNWGAFFSMALPPRQSTQGFHPRLTDIDYVWWDGFDGYACFLPEYEGEAIDESIWSDLDGECEPLWNIAWEDWQEVTHLVFLNEQWGGETYSEGYEWPRVDGAIADVWGPFFSIVDLQAPCLEDLPELAWEDETEEWIYHLEAEAYGGVYGRFENRESDSDDRGVRIDARSYAVIADPRDVTHVVSPGGSVTLVVDPMTYWGARRRSIRTSRSPGPASSSWRTSPCPRPPVTRSTGTSSTSSIKSRGASGCGPKASKATRRSSTATVATAGAAAATSSSSSPCAFRRITSSRPSRSRPTCGSSSAATTS